MVRNKNDVVYWILSFLNETDAPQGAGLLLEEIRQKDVNISEATIGRMLRTLRTQGLLERVSNLGHKITPPGREYLGKLQKERGLGATLRAVLSESEAGGVDNLVEVLIARRALEREAVIQATKNASEEELDELGGIIRTQYEMMERGEDYSVMSGNFHRAIIKMSHVPLLETMYNFIGMSTTWQSFFIGMFMMYDIPANLEHEKVFKAMRERNAEKAGRIMSAHIDDVIRNAQKLTEMEEAKKRITPIHP